MEYLRDTDPVESFNTHSPLTTEQNDIVKDLRVIYDLYQNGTLSKSDYEFSITLSTKDAQLDFNTLSELVEEPKQEDTSENFS